MLLIKLSAIDSTNKFLKQWVQQSKEHVSIGVWAEHQTQGRGRMNTEWLSPKGLNLTASVYLGNLNMSNDSIFDINKQVCLAVMDTLFPLQIPNLTIKWPNDILSGGKKLGGILVEPMIRGSVLTDLIIGCGININQTKFSDLPHATSLRLVSGKTFSVATIFDTLVKNIENAVRSGATDDQRYYELLFGYGKECSFQRLEGTPFKAVIIGVSREGKLILKHQSGEQEEVEEKKLVFTAFAH